MFTRYSNEHSADRKTSESHSVAENTSAQFTAAQACSKTEDFFLFFFFYFT